MEPRPGDVLLLKGRSLPGWAVRHATGSPWAHVTLIHHAQGCTVWTRESHPGVGHRECTREWHDAPAAVACSQSLLLRPRHDSATRDRLLAEHAHLAETDGGYDYAEGARMGARGLGVRLPVVDVAPSRSTCSGGVARAWFAADPAIAARFPVAAHAMWPGALAAALLGVCDVVPLDAVWTLPRRTGVA